MLRSVRGRAQVLLQGKPVGELAFASGGSTFRYTDDLRAHDHQVLGQLFEESPRGRFAERIGLPAWFSNLLPEQGSGLRRYYAARFDERELDDARLLLNLGHDLPGAVAVVPLDIPADGVLVDRWDARLDELGVHLSALAGAQFKMSVLREGDRLTLPASGQDGGWIAKFPDPLFRNLAENELLMMRWASLSGIDVPSVDLVSAASVPDIFERGLDPDSPVFVIERFDRLPSGGRVHIEDLAQAIGIQPRERDSGTTYDRIGSYILAITGPAGFEEYLRRLVAIVVMGNGDAHLKNWSLRYADGRNAELSPAYDLVCTSIYRNLAPRLTFPLNDQQYAEAIGIDDFARLADFSGFPTTIARQIVEATVESLRATWSEAKGEADFPELIAHIDERLDSLPIMK